MRRRLERTRHRLDNMLGACRRRAPPTRPGTDSGRLSITCFGLWLVLGLGASAVWAQPTVVDPPEPPPEGRHLHQTFLLARLDSPKAVWSSFIALTSRLNGVLQTQPPGPKRRRIIASLRNQITLLFDLREIAPSLRTTEAVEAAVYLREAIARFRPLQPGMLPDRDQAFEQMAAGRPPIWQVETPLLAIVYIESGPWSGSFQFSPRTLASAQQQFAAAAELSYVDQAVEGLYEAYFLRPGSLLPSGWLDQIPDALQALVLGNTLLQWIITLLGLLLLITALFLIRRLVAMSFGRGPALFSAVGKFVTPLVGIGLIFAYVDFLDEVVAVTGQLLQALNFAKWAVVLFATVVLTFAAANLFLQLALSARGTDPQSVDAHLLRFAVRIGAVIIAAAVLIEGATQLGFSLATVLTGAGVTGLAFALAAQESLRGVFASLVLLVEKPFAVGQRIIVDGLDGYVEAVGLQNTRLRLLNGHLAVIPNEDLAKAKIENVDERPSILRHDRIPLRFDTEPAKVDEAVEIIRDILTGDDGDAAEQADRRCVNHPDDWAPQVHFERLDDAGPSILIWYYFRPPDYWRFLAHSQRVNQRILARFNTAGIELAFPGQRLALSADPAGPTLSAATRPNPR